MKKLKSIICYTFYTLFLAVFFTSCEINTGYTKQYIVTKSDDNNWTTSAIIECDSVSMEGRKKAIMWIDGRKMIIEADLIKIFSNTNYVSRNCY